MVIAYPARAQSDGSVQPHWLEDGRSFWYAEGAPENTVIYRVDPMENTKEALFDSKRLRASLTDVLGREPPGKGLPFEDFAFVDARQAAIEFAIGDDVFVLQLDTYSTTPASRPSAEAQQLTTPQVVKRWRWSWPDLMETPSPDGKWLLGIDAQNPRLRSTSDGHLVPLTSDDAEGYEWLMGFEGGVGSGVFSPDSRKLALARADMRQVPRLPITYYLEGAEDVAWLRAPRAGQPMASLELFAMDTTSGQQIRIDTGDQPDQRLAIVGWLPDGSELLLRREDRVRRRVELIGADSSTGMTRPILSEEGRAGFVTLVGGGEQFIWASERDGWNHLYLPTLPVEGVPSGHALQPGPTAADGSETVRWYSTADSVPRERRNGYRSGMGTVRGVRRQGRRRDHESTWSAIPASGL